MPLPYSLCIYCGSRFGTDPAYRETARTGPAHAPRFTIEASVDGEMPETGEGGSKREAEQEAAAKLLARVTA